MKEGDTIHTREQWECVILGLPEAMKLLSFHLDTGRSYSCVIRATMPVM
jgi:hypothetical protein